MCAAALTVVTYAIVAKPNMIEGAVLGSVALQAHRPEAPTREWTLSPEELVQNSSGVIGPASTHELMKCLRSGQSIRLPGVYNSYEVVRLGYRKAHPKGKKRQAHRLVGLLE